MFHHSKFVTLRKCQDQHLMALVMGSIYRWIRRQLACECSHQSQLTHWMFEAQNDDLQNQDA